MSQPNTADGDVCPCPDPWCPERGFHDDSPTFAVLSRDVGTGQINIVSRHLTRHSAEFDKDKLAWKFNTDRVTKHLMVVEL